MALAILIAVVISAMTVHSLVLHLEDEEARQYPEGCSGVANLVNIDPRDWSRDDLLAASILASTMAADTRFYTTHAQGMDKNAAEIVCDSLAQLAMNLSSEVCRRAV